ncbi:unnamed protein product [Vicia faba]|uniref:Uncharacterized protein n=1 Tax=Vicia faba TaxID=3906 RepID=A0AAV0YVG7_VICFA|nr:unnamed protein product [Vicia faba]
MGTSHSTHTNLGKDSTSFKSSATGSIARWGDSFEVSMSKWNENDHTEAWGAKYKTSLKNRTCGFNLKVTNGNNGIDSIHFGLLDTANNKTELAVNISRIDHHTLRGGITGLSSSVSPKSFTRTKPDYLIETTVVSYNCSHREGLFVLEMKKKGNSENACIVNLAHYYVTKDVGLSVRAKIYRNKAVEFGHRVLVLTVKEQKQRLARQNNGKVVGEVVKHGFFSSTVREQINTGLINSTGYTSGTLNNSIIFVECNF